MPETSPESRPRAFDFADLGRPRPASVRSLAAAAETRAPDSGQLDELSVDDILESDDIATFEAAAAGIRSFETPPSAPAIQVAPAPAPSDPNGGFEVAEMGAFDEVEVEGLAARPTMPSPQPAAAPATPAPAREDHVVEAAPISMKLDYASPSPATIIGMPAAPVTSPLPLADMIDEEAFPERTLEIRGGDMAKVQAVAENLDAAAPAAAEPERTEILSRAAMPAQLQPQPAAARGWQPMNTPAPAPVAPAQQRPVTAPQQVHAHQAPRRPSSIAPVALDVASPRPPMPSVPQAQSYMPPPRRGGVSGLAIGGILGAAVLLIGLVGIGGFVATRALSDKPEATATAPSEVSGETTTTAAAAPVTPSPATEAAGAAADPGAPATLDVSSLPSAPARGAAAPRGFTGSTGFGSDAPAAPAAAAAAPRSGSGSALAAPGGARTTTTTLAPPGPAPTQATRGGNPLPPPGQALAAPGGGAPTALPPPVAAAAPAAAAPASASGTGVIRVDPKLRAVVIDGGYRRATDGAVTVSCGQHRVKAGMNDVQTVNVPCGGAVSL